MNKSKYTNYNDLPLMLSVPDVASVLGISRAGAYELVRSDGFPSLRMLSNLFHSGTVCDVVYKVLALVEVKRIYFFCLLYEFGSML